MPPRGDGTRGSRRPRRTRDSPRCRNPRRATSSSISKAMPSPWTAGSSTSSAPRTGAAHTTAAGRWPNRPRSVAAATRALVRFEAALASGEADGTPHELRAEIEDYNRDDCLSTLRLAEWLEACGVTCRRWQDSRCRDRPPETWVTRPRTPTPPSPTSSSVVFCGTVFALDEAERTIDLKRGRNSPVPHPSALVPLDVVNSRVLRDSLLRLGRDMASDGFATERAHPAAFDLLRRVPPRLDTAAPRPNIPSLQRRGQPRRRHRMAVGSPGDGGRGGRARMRRSGPDEPRQHPRRLSGRGEPRPAGGSAPARSADPGRPPARRGRVGARSSARRIGDGRPGRRRLPGTHLAHAPRGLRVHDGTVLRRKARHASGAGSADGDRTGPAGGTRPYRWSTPATRTPRRRKQIASPC